MQSKKLGRAAAAAGLVVLLAPGVAIASWWDGGYDGRYDNGYTRRATTTTEHRTAPGYGQPPDGTSPGYGSGPGEAPPPDNGPPPSSDYSPPPDSPPTTSYNPPRSDYGPPPDYDRAPGCCGAPAPPPPPPLGPIYGCENSTLPGTELALHKTTTPPPGTPVSPGDEILVDIVWNVHDWIGPDLHKAIDCVYIDGLLVEGLSGGERPTPNDGHFAFHYVVPLDAPIGAEICDQGFVSGPNGYDDYFREVSNVVCFPICPPVDQPPPPPPPPAEEPTTTTTTAPEENPSPYAQSERYEQEAPPEASPAPVVLPRQELPRTGTGSTAARLAAAGLALLTLIRRRTRRG